MSVRCVRGIRSSLALLLLGSLTASCSNGDGVGISGLHEDEASMDDSRFVVGNDGPEGNSGLTANDVRYPLDAALGDIWGVSDNHFRIDFTLTNGNFRVETVTVDDIEYQLLVPAQSTAVFYARIFSPGRSFDYANYSHVPTGSVSTALSGVGYFKDAYVGLDENHDGTVSRDEQHAVIDGVVEFSGTRPDIELQFQVTLADGTTVSGEYTGLFDFTPR